MVHRTGVTVVRQSNLDHLPFKEFKFFEFSNVIVGNFEAGLLVGKLSCNLSTHFGHHVYVFLNDLSLFFASLRHYWRRWWGALPPCLIKKIPGLFLKSRIWGYVVQLSFFSSIYLVIINWYCHHFCFPYFAIVICIWWLLTDTFIVVSFL